MTKWVMFVLLLVPLAFATGPGSCSNFAGGTCPANVPSGVTHFWFVDFNAGSDSNSGATESLALKHVPGMTGCSGNCSTSPVSGDGYILKGGSVWTNAALPWAFVWAGTSANPIYVGYDPGWNQRTINAIIPTSSGFNCTAISVGLSGGGGSSGAGTANFQTSGYLYGLLQHITITNQGSGYTSNPTVSFSGSSCSENPTAVADIYRPIIDASGTTWNETNGAFTGLGPIDFSGVSYVTVDHLEFRNALFDHTIANGSGSLYLLTQQSGTGSIYENIYLHNFGPNAISESGTPSFNGTGGFSINQGEGGTVTVTNSFLDNYENEVSGSNCGWSDGGTPNYYQPPCGSSAGIQGATTFTNNIIHDSRGQVYSPTANGLIFSGNTIWDTVYDCCEQHPDTFYFFGSGVVANNIIHDAAPLAAANFYIETCQGNPCTVGNVTYIFNNVAWNVATSTPDIGFTSEFWGTGNVTPSPALYAWNNTFLAQNGNVSCINAGQWFGNSSTYTVNFYLFNNHCISTQSGAHWYASPTGNYGTWNGLSNPNNSGTQSTIDAANTIMPPTADPCYQNPSLGTVCTTTQGYAITNNFAPTASSNSTVTASGTNLTSSSPGCGTSGLTILCSDINSVARAASGNWQDGAYWFSSGQAAAPSCTPTSGVVPQTVTCIDPNGGIAVMCYNFTGSPATNDLGTGCTTGTQYTTALNINTPETLYIVAGTSALTDSTVSSYTYSPANGSYGNGFLRGAVVD